MEFLEYSKKCHFWLFPKNHKKYATIGTKVNDLPHFCLKRALRYLERFRTIIGHFGTRRIFYGYQNAENPQMKISKNTIFQNYIKIELKGLWYRFEVQNAPKTPHVFISGHMTCVRSIPAELSKIEILAKITILTIFNGISTCPPFGRKWPDMWYMAKNGLSRPLRYLYIPWMTLYDA